MGYGASLATLLGVYDFTGGSLKTIWKDVGLDEVSRKEMIRATRQRPVEELVAYIGESSSKIPDSFVFPPILTYCLQLPMLPAMRKGEKRG